jgi:hypothetical protein
MGGSGQTLVVEIFVASGFLLLGVLGFKTNLWLIPAAMIGHGVFDFIHHSVIDNPGVPSWWPLSGRDVSLAYGWPRCCGGRIRRSSQSLVINPGPMRVLERESACRRCSPCRAHVVELSGGGHGTVVCSDLVAICSLSRGGYEASWACHFGEPERPSISTPGASSTLVRSGVPLRATGVSRVFNAVTRLGDLHVDALAFCSPRVRRLHESLPNRPEGSAQSAWPGVRYIQYRVGGGYNIARVPVHNTG